MRPGTRRITIETLAAGQPRPYADTVHTYRITFEWVPYMGRKTDFEPVKFSNQAQARGWLEGLKLGLGPKTPFKAEPREWHETYIEKLTEISPGVWELSLISPFTD